MTARGFATSAEPYAPRRRTALILSGTGTAGAYHAGVLRALHEAGVKIDIVAGRGVGVVGALFAAVDGAQRLWEDKGFWRSRAVRHLYVWRPIFRAVIWSLAAAAALLVVPLGAMAAGLVVFPVDFVLKMLGSSAAGGLTSSYLAFTERAFAPDALPTWLPRLVVLVLGVSGVAALIGGWIDRDRRRRRGPFWWRTVRAPMSAGPVIDRCWAVMWDLIRGAARLKQPRRVDLARRYAELLVDNLGQPGFRELCIVVHDLDARRDLVFALVNEQRRRDLMRRATTAEAESRRAEVIDLGGIGRDHLADAVSASLSIPLATDPHSMTFSADAYWRGETHRLCDRPGSIIRLIDELASLDAEQIIVVTAAPDSPGPHALAALRVDGRGRIGEHLQAFESAAVRDAAQAFNETGPRIFMIRPAHNAVGPLDFGGGFDDRSDRRQGLDELMTRGYEDAYHQFIEPVVGASGDRVGQVL